MAELINLVVGDLVVRNGKILKVSQVKKDTICLRPFFHIKTSNGLTYTLLTAHTYDGHIRKLLSKSQIGKLLNLIIKKPTPKKDYPEFDAETALNHNQHDKTLWVIKTLWCEMEKNSGVLPGTKLSIYKQAMIRACEEIAAVNKTTLEKAKSLILSGLKHSQKNPHKRKN